MTTKIIDNLQIMIQGVHIRYEDSLSSPGNPFSIGLTLSELSATSVDSDWQSTFVQNSGDSSYKLAKLDSLAIYWNTDTVSLAGKTQEDFLETFRKLISKDNNIPNHQYILRPVNGEGKIRLNKMRRPDQAKTDVALLFDEIAVAMDQDQYRDALKMVDTFHFFLRHQEYRKYRPRNTVREDPKAWFQFAIKSVRRGIHEKNIVWSWDNMRRRRDARLKYIDLFKSKQSETISLDQSAELKALEEELAYVDIRLYRSLAKNQLKKENALKPKQVAKQAQGWLSWAWTGSHAGTDQANAQGDTVMTEQQRKELYNAIEWDEKQALSDGLDIPEDSVLLNISAKLRKGSLTLRKSKFLDGEDILQLLFERFGAHFKQRPNSMFADLALEGMRILDGTTPGTLYKEIVRVKDSQDRSNSSIESGVASSADVNDLDIKDPLFYASFEDRPLSGIARSEIVARLKALEIVYNVHCIETLLQFVKPPKSQMESITALMEVAGEAAKDFRESGRASLEFALTEHKTLAAHLDLQAPLIIVPESCTDINAACIVLDAGKIHIESDLVQQDKIKEIQARENQQLTTGEMTELQSLCYDKFKLRLESTQILIGPTVGQALTALRSEEDRRYHVVDRINMEFLLEISILPKTASLTLTKFRISGHLPTLSARVSDTKYKTMMRIIDVAVPKDDDADADAQNLAKTAAVQPDLSKSNKGDRTFSSAFSKVPELDVDTYREDEEAIEDDENEKFVAAPMNLDEKDLLYRQKIFEFRFTVGELRGSLYKAEASAEDDGQLLVDIVLQQFALDFVLRQYDMRADVVLKSLVVEDRMNLESPVEFQKLVTSEQIGEDDQEQQDLVRVKYVQVKPESPEFQSVYGGVDKNVDIALSTINVIVTQKSILTLFDFILTTFTSPEASVPGQDITQDAAVSPADSTDIKEAADDSKMKVKVELTSIVLVLNQDGIRLATLKMSKGDVGVFLNGPTLRVGAKLGDLSVRDDINQGSDEHSNFRQIISIEGEELVDFQYETFDDKIVAHYPGYDSSIYLRLNSVKINFLEEPLRKIMNFGSKFARMKAIFDDARNAAFSQAQQVQERAGKMHFDVLIRTPIVVFPRISSQTSERDVIVANLGELFANNSFERIDDTPESSFVNTIKTGIRNISLSSKFHYRDNQSESLQMIDDADASLQLEMMERQDDSETPDVRVVGNVSDIKLKVTQSQYKFLMDLSQSIPMIFVGDDLDQEERQLGVTLGQQRGSGTSLSEQGKPFGDLEPELGSDTEEASKVEVGTSLDANFTIGDLVMEIFTNNEETPVGDLPKSSLTRFSLNSTKAKLATRSDNSLQGELNVKSFTVEDTRHSKNNKFREVIPAIKHDGHQFNASVTISGGIEKALVAMLTIDTPRMIFSLEYLFALQVWAMSAFKGEDLDDEINAAAESGNASGSLQLAQHSDSPLAPRTSIKTDANRPRDKVGGQTSRKLEDAQLKQANMSIAYRVNIVDPSIILVANSGKSDTDAIVLSAKQLLLVQQSVLTLNLDKVGMYITKMNELDSRRLRVLDDFSMNLSLDSRSNAIQQAIQVIEMDVGALVLRLSLRDIMLVMQIATSASQLSVQAGPKSPEMNDTGTSRRRSSTIAASASRRKSVGATSRPNRRSIANQSLATKIKDETPDATKSDSTGDPFKSAIVSREELRATFAGLRLVLIGDLHELPMLDMSIDQFTVDIKDWSSQVLTFQNRQLNTDRPDVHRHQHSGFCQCL